MIQTFRVNLYMTKWFANWLHHFGTFTYYFWKCLKIFNILIFFLIINREAFWYLNISTSMPSLLLNRTCTRISMILPFLLSLNRPWDCVDSQTVEISHHQWRSWWSQFSPRILYSSWFSTRQPVGIIRRKQNISVKNNFPLHYC